MKKIILILLVFLVTGCSMKNENDTLKQEEKEDIKIESEVEVEDVEVRKKDQKIDLGFFLYDNNYQNKDALEDTVYLNFTPGKDIGSFEVLLTSETKINARNFKDAWNKYSNYEDKSDFKLGYNIKFILASGENFNYNFTKPDIFKCSPYFYVYMYDDVNQKDGVIYNHLEEIDDNTIMTSVKIYATDYIKDVQNIILTVYAYDSLDDFDSEGNYIGENMKVVRIKRK